MTAPPGVVHGFKVVQGPSRLIVISTPGDKTEQLVRAMVEAFAVGDDPRRMAEILARADIESSDNPSQALTMLPGPYGTWRVWSRCLWFGGEGASTDARKGIVVSFDPKGSR